MIIINAYDILARILSLLQIVLGWCEISVQRPREEFKYVWVLFCNCICNRRAIKIGMELISLTEI